MRHDPLTGTGKCKQRDVCEIGREGRPGRKKGDGERGEIGKKGRGKEGDGERRENGNGE